MRLLFRRASLRVRFAALRSAIWRLRGLNGLLIVLAVELHL